MKTLIQRLPLDRDCSFIARTFETPDFETPYHQHAEYELMVVRRGTGTVFVGDFIGEYRPGDVYLHGKKLPHWYKKKEEEMKASSMVLQFGEDVFGEHFFDLPEMLSVRALLDNSSRGIHCHGSLKKSIGKQLLEIESLKGYLRLRSLLDMLHEISISRHFEYLSSPDDYNYSTRDKDLINRVFEYSLANFRRKIALEEVAGLTNKSISAFSHYFKKTTKMSYVKFLTQIRISHACSLLKETDLSVAEVCYSSGFNSWANFSKHFKDLHQISPGRFRSKYRMGG